MKQQFNTVGLGKAIKTKRQIDLNIGLRDAAKLTKISPATLSRMENGHQSEIGNIIKACNWIGVSMCDFVVPVSKSKPSPKQ